MSREAGEESFFHLLLLLLFLHFWLHYFLLRCCPLVLEFMSLRRRLHPHLYQLCPGGLLRDRQAQKLLPMRPALWTGLHPESS